MADAKEVIEIAVDADVLREAEGLGVDIARAVELGLRSAIRDARILRDLEDDDRT